MLRFTLLLVCAALTSEAAHATRITRYIEVIQFSGTVESVVASNRSRVLDLYRSGEVLSVDLNDPRFLLTVRIAEVTPTIDGLNSGSSVVFGIHSPVMLFDTTESAYIVGRTYRFRIERETNEKIVTYSGLKVAPETKSADSIQTEK